MRSVLRTRAVSLAVVFALGIVVPAFGQQASTSGGFRGRVTGEDGRPVAGAQVSVVNEATGLQRGVLTDAEGRYLLPLIAPGGPYKLRVVSIGYEPVERVGYEVRAGDAITVNVTLNIQAVQIEEIVAVGNATRIDVTQGGVVQNVGAVQVDNLPVNGRDFTDFLNLSALVSPHPEVGTGGQFAIGGARTSGTNVQVDGTDANNVFFGENRGSSRMPFAFSLESIKEFQLITNGFDVEHGNYQGGVVNAITKGGTNEFQGSAFYYQRGEALTAKDFQGLDPQDFTVKQFGFSLSGPIIRDRLHFFVSADGQDKSQPIHAGSVAASGITADQHAQIIAALRDVYGVQNPEKYFGTFQETEDNLVLFGRLDWNINLNHRLTLRQNYSDFEQLNDRINRYEAVTNGGPYLDKALSTVAELNSVLGTSAFNTLRIQWSYEDRPRDGNPDGGYLPTIDIRGLGTGSSNLVFGGDGVVFRNRLEETKLQFIDNFTYRLGDHTLKLGTNNMWSRTANTFWLNGNGFYRFNSLQAFQNGEVAYYSRNMRACPSPFVTNENGEAVICPDYDVPFAQFDVLELSGYAQDDWQVSDRLLLTAGVRYGKTIFRDEPGEVAPVEQAFGVATGIVPDFSAISPRVSFTYDLGTQSQVVRGGVGLLVGRTPTVLAGNVFQTDKPLLSIYCTGAANIPVPNFGEWLSVDRGELNPAACLSGAAPTGTPEHTLFSEDFELPRTLKANLGYERLLGSGTRIGIDLLYSESWNNFLVQDLNLKAEQFRLAGEDRPVFVPQARYNPTSRPSTDRRANTAFDRIYYNTSEGEARAFNARLDLSHRLSEVLDIGAQYAFNYAYDNSSFSCCTSSEGFSGESTAGDPNFVGDPGDDKAGAWGPSRFERRHVFVANFVYDGPWGIRVNGIWRSQSGTPWTPLVDGDVNADGIDYNDRAMISTDLAFETPEDAALFNELLDEYDCLADQLGRIAGRNSCRNPWWHSVDLRLAKTIHVPGLAGHRAELLVDLFNVLNGLNSDWGRFMGVYSDRAELLKTESFDAATGKVVYSVNPKFGEEQPIGFDPFQFQAQVGVRYRF